MPRARTVIGTIVAALLGLPATASAGDWPQILGERRDGRAAADERLPDALPPGGPRRAWQRKVGSGYAGIAVVGARAYLFHRVEGAERLEALDRFAQMKGGAKT